MSTETIILGGCIAATLFVIYYAHKNQPKVAYPTGRDVLKAASATDSRKVPRTKP
jgi:hypothetical protein